MGAIIWENAGGSNGPLPSYTSRWYESLKNPLTQLGWEKQFRTIPGRREKKNKNRMVRSSVDAFANIQIRDLWHRSYTARNEGAYKIDTKRQWAIRPQHVRKPTLTRLMDVILATVWFKSKCKTYDWARIKLTTKTDNNKSNNGIVVCIPKTLWLAGVIRGMET